MDCNIYQSIFENLDVESKITRKKKFKTENKQTKWKSLKKNRKNIHIYIIVINRLRKKKLTVRSPNCLTRHGKCTNDEPSDIVTFVDIDSVSKYGDIRFCADDVDDCNDDDDDNNVVDDESATDEPPADVPPKNCRPRSRSSDDDINSSEYERTKRIVANLLSVIIGWLILSSFILWLSDNDDDDDGEQLPRKLTKDQKNKNYYHSNKRKERKKIDSCSHVNVCLCL